MLTRKQKQELLEKLGEKLAKMKAAVFADYTGLTVAKMTELRRKLKGQNAEIKVVKKTLLDLALKNKGWEKIEPKKMSGQLALIIGYEDEVAPSKVVYNFSKTDEHLKILGGIFNNDFISGEGIISLAKLPSRQELLAKAVGSLAAPLSGMVNVLQGNLRGLVYVLSQIRK
ncbi:MAG: large subunit ribosomal protein L10 [Parcubacteria group bacterium LiPW_39]|nr:MAG: large subunit ribosomal protein L10 [Parcubacteria group bacterium LiPW_39]